MADNKKYYYLKLRENFFDTDEMIILESMPDGHLYSNILLKLYLRSLKNEGKLMFNDKIPFSATMLAQVTRHSVGVIEKAMGIFKELNLVDVLDNGSIYMSDIQNFIGESSTVADRLRDYRKRIDSEKALKTQQISNDISNDISNVQQKYDKSTPEIEIELEIEKEIELELETKVNYQLIADMYNDTCVSFPKCTVLSDKRRKAIKARLTTYTVNDFKKLFEIAQNSNFLKGKNNRNWQATFDWLIQDSNMAKVLDGNYNNKDSCHTAQEKRMTRGEVL